jgi:hypothetical protein
MAGPYYNSTSLGTQGRTGASLLVSGSRGRRGSLQRIYSRLGPAQKQVFYNAQVTFLYGVGGSENGKGITGGLFG